MLLLLIKIIHTVMTKRKMPIKESNQKDSNDTLTNLKHGITIEKVSVVVNILLVIMTIFAINNSNKANETSQAALTELIKKDSSDDTKSDFDKKSLMAQNRAYIFINTVNLNHISGDSFQVDVNVKNSGKTPGYDFQSAKIIRTKKNDDIGSDSLWLSQKYYTSGKSVIGSDQDQDLIQSQPFTLKENNILKLNLYLIFKMQYFDIYGEEHRTRMYAVYDIRHKKFVKCKNFNDNY